MRKKKTVPALKSEKQIADFWATHDSADTLDWSQARAVQLPHLKPSTQSVPIRFPVPLLQQIRQLANQRNVAYQALIKLFLFERVQQELAAART